MKRIAATLLLLVGCSSSSGADGGPAAAFIAQLCGNLMPCCAEIGKSTDPAQCEKAYAASSASASFDARAASACLSEMDAAAGSPTFCSDALRHSTPSCADVFKAQGGTKLPGEGCASRADCAPSSEGEVACLALDYDFTTITKCHLKLVGHAGDTCLGTIDGIVTSSHGPPQADTPPRGVYCDVADGLYCDFGIGKCVAIAKLGEACTSSASYACVAGAYCDATQAKCAARKPRGQACTSTFECASESCESGACASGSGNLAIDNSVCSN